LKRKFSRRLLIALASLVTTLAVAAVAPWLLYWIGLSKIDGRPKYAFQTIVTAEETNTLWRKLRISQPVRIDPISPYSYILQDRQTQNASTRIAWIIARSHNSEHLTDRRYWHLSSAALTIWLTRNWTASELIAKGLELEKPTSASTVPQ